MTEKKTLPKLLKELNAVMALLIVTLRKCRAIHHKVEAQIKLAHKRSKS